MRDDDNFSERFDPVPGGGRGDGPESRPGGRLGSANDSDVKSSRLFLGLTLIAIGVAYILDRLGYVDASEIWGFWPVILIAAGVGKLMTPGSGSGKITGGLLAAIGTWLLLENLNLVDVSFREWWPLVLVAIGLRLMLGTRRVVSAEARDSVNGFAALGGTSRSNSSDRFKGGDLLAFMGGVEIDLRGARIAGEPAVIDAFAFFGGVDIKVPPDWQVKATGIPVLGGFGDSTEFRPEDADPTAPPQRLVVKGFAIMGGVDVSN